MPTNSSPVSSDVALVQADRLAWLALAGIWPLAMAPTTVPMKNGVSNEEKAKVAPAARRCGQPGQFLAEREPGPAQHDPGHGQP